jgi:hypothetical protein
MKYLISTFVFLIFISLTGCVGPLVMHETARTVGNSNSELLGGYGKAGFVLKWNYGLAEKLDIGLQTETLSFGLRLKYALIDNQRNGFSLATALGAGISWGGSHNYGEIIGSYLTGKWEPYSAFRLVRVKIDPTEVRDHDMNIDFTTDEFKYNYTQFILGTRFWFNDHWLFSLEGSRASANVANIVLLSGGIGYRF